jgi:hypothetical protein
MFFALSGKNHSAYKRMEGDTTFHWCQGDSSQGSDTTYSVYAMFVFKMPKNICKKITDVIAQFWWGDDDQGKRMHWYAWWKLCFAKKEGGTGFKIYTLST